MVRRKQRNREIALSDSFAKWEPLKKVGDKKCVLCGKAATKVLKFKEPKNNVYSCEGRDCE